MSPSCVDAATTDVRVPAKSGGTSYKGFVRRIRLCLCRISPLQSRIREFVESHTACLSLRKIFETAMFLKTESSRHIHRPFNFFVEQNLRNILFCLPETFMHCRLHPGVRRVRGSQNSSGSVFDCDNSLTSPDAPDKLRSTTKSKQEKQEDLTPFR